MGRFTGNGAFLVMYGARRAGLAWGEGYKQAKFMVGEPPGGSGDPLNTTENRIQDGVRSLSWGRQWAFLSEPLSWVPLFLAICVLMMWGLSGGARKLASCII